MTRTRSEASNFAERALVGFVASQPDRVIAVRGGVVRSALSPVGQVAIVMGGGSGHFPAFSGWVGVGFGHGAACGNIFSSPSDAQIYSVSRAADNGGGVLFVPINYSGDILHFGAAADRLRTEGVDVRMVPVTDDVASGPPETRSIRRGVAGSFVVLKIAGAAAEEGRSLDEVEQIALLANDATRSFGVAFSGCTLPGADRPLFEVPEGRMAIGLGIHGEPGVAEVDLGSTDEVADILLAGLLADRPPERDRRVAVVVNGLGAMKYDELFIVFERVRARLDGYGMTVVAPVVGEQVTSLDMAGVSLTLTYLDDELERLWRAPADSASFSRGTIVDRPHRDSIVEAAENIEIGHATTESKATAEFVAKRFAAVLAVLRANEEHLGKVDAAAGDGDHGTAMTRGVAAAMAAAESSLARGAGLGTLVARAGAEWSDRSGGTSGALWATGLGAAASVLGDREHPSDEKVVRAAKAFLEAIEDRGGAAPGDKTMVDAIGPFVRSLEDGVRAGSSLMEAWRRAAAVAVEAAERTSDMVASRGRSRIHGVRSRGVPDAGALSFALVVSALGEPVAAPTISENSKK